MPRAMGDGTNVVVKEVKRKVNGRTVTEKRLFARVRYTDPATGRRRAKWRRVENRTEARVAVQELAAEVRAIDPAAEDAKAVTFGDLATLYAATSLQPAEYRDGRKVAGRRSLQTARGHFKWLCDFFGAVEGGDGRFSGGPRLSSITYEQLDGARRRLLATPVGVTPSNPAGRPRTIASVNRRLALLRNMLNVAVRRGWLARNPFSAGPALISPADERGRRRILSFEEEERLLAQCESFTEKEPGRPPRNVFRAHLRAIVICALDTAMRQGEILKLRWRDLDALTEGGRRRLTVQQLNTKTLQERGAPVSKRLRSELDRLREETGGRPGALVFGVATVKHSFASACRDAGIEGLRFHDLRRTAATRLHREGMPVAEVARILGHADVATTFRYIGVDSETTERAAEIFDRIEGRRREERKKRMKRGAVSGRKG